MFGKEALLKRGRLLVSVGCIINLPMRIVCTVSTPAVEGAKSSLIRLKEEIFACDIFVAWVKELNQGVSSDRLIEWFRNRGWIKETGKDVDLIGIDCVHVFDSFSDVNQFSLQTHLTHAIVDSDQWIGRIEAIPRHYLLSDSWTELERRLLNE